MGVDGPLATMLAPWVGLKSHLWPLLERVVRGEFSLDEKALGLVKGKKAAAKAEANAQAEAKAELSRLRVDIECNLATVVEKLG